MLEKLTWNSDAKKAKALVGQAVTVLAADFASKEVRVRIGAGGLTTKTIPWPDDKQLYADIQPNMQGKLVFVDRKFDPKLKGDIFDKFLTVVFP